MAECVLGCDQLTEEEIDELGSVPPQGRNDHPDDSEADDDNNNSASNDQNGQLPVFEIQYVGANINPISGAVALPRGHVGVQIVNSDTGEVIASVHGGPDSGNDGFATPGFRAAVFGDAEALVTGGVQEGDGGWN